MLNPWDLFVLIGSVNTFILGRAGHKVGEYTLDGMLDHRKHTHTQSQSHLGTIWCNQSTYLHALEKWNGTRELGGSPHKCLK